MLYFGLYVQLRRGSVAGYTTDESWAYGPKEGVEAFESITFFIRFIYAINFEHLLIYGIYIHNIGIIFGIFSAVVLTAYLLESGVIRVNKFLSDGSFFLYALHALLMLVLARCITKVFFVDSLFYTVALYFIVPCLTTAVSFGLYELLRRYTPRICAVLTGGR